MKRTNKIFALLLAVLMVIAIIPMSAITAFADATGDAPTEVRLPYDYMEMEVGDRYTCSLNMVPTTANPDLVNLTSSDPTVVFTSGKELIALKEGEVTVTAMTISGVTDTMKVKVVGEFLTETNQTKNIQFHEALNSTSASYRIGVGNKIPKPADPAKEGYVFCGWYEDSMMGTGFANLWLFDSETVEETDKDIIDLYAKFVPEADFVPTTDFSFRIDNENTDTKTLDIKLKSSYTIELRCTPDNATLDIATWTVSDPNVLTIRPLSYEQNVTKYMYIDCLKPGTVTVTATIGTLTKSCTITVVDTSVYPDSVTLNYDECEVFKGTESAKLVATLTPNNVDSNAKTLTWTSSDEEVLGLTVDSDTLSASLVAKKAGTATVTVITKDGKHSDTCVVTVSNTLKFELNGYLPGGNVSDISVTGPSQTSSIQQYKLYYNGAEVTDKISDKIKYKLEFLFVCDPVILDNISKENIKLGELTATGFVRSGADNARVTFELPALEYVEIDSLDIYITPPIAGQTPATTLTGSDPRVNVTVNWSPSPSVFVEGTTYLLSLTLDVKPGYKFPEAILMDAEEFQSQGKYKINGANVLSISYTLPSVTGTTILSEISLWHSFTALPPHTHTYTNSVLQKDATHHWLECDATDCPDKLGSIKDKAEHSASTPATCVAKAICACGLEIGELGTHSFATDAWNEEVPATCVATGTKGYKDCSVCHKHFAADGVTEITDLTIAIDTTNHDMATEWTKTADGHYYACKRTGCEHHGEVYAHNPDKAAATEAESVNCSVCGYVITPALGHTTHTPKTEWKSDADNHWHECTGCEGQQLEKAAHADANNDEKCDACGYDMPATGTEPGTTPGTNDPNTPDDPDKKDGLGAGAIIGIVVGVLAVLGGGGFALYWFVLKKKPTDPTDPITPVEEAPDTDVDADTDEDAEATDEDDSPETEDPPETEDAPETEDKKDTE